MILVLFVGVLLSLVYRGSIPWTSFSDIRNEDEIRVNDYWESRKQPQKYSDAEKVTLLPEREFDYIDPMPNTVSEKKGDYYFRKENGTSSVKFKGESANTDQEKKLGSIDTYRLTPSTASSAFPATSSASFSSSSASFATTNTSSSITVNLDTIIASSVAHSTTPSSLNLKQNIQGDETQKNILFYTNFFYGSWENFLKERTLLDHACPVSSCRFLFDPSHPEEADAVVFHAGDIKMETVPGVRRPNQLYIWLNMEAPNEPETIRGLLPVKSQFKSRKKINKKDDNKLYGTPGFFNWTFTYHQDSDLLLLYGGLWPLNGEQ